MSPVVFFGAHADDVEIGAGGTCAKLTAAGYDVHIVIATDEADAAVVHRRRAEAISGARALGVPAASVHFLGFPDGDLRCTRAAVGHVRAFLTRANLRPAAVFTHTDFDSHNDHVELTKIVRGALRNAVIFKYIVRNSAVVSHFTPQLYSRVDHMLGAKARALLQHTTQVAAGRISIDKLFEFGERFGVAESGEHLEAFDLEMQDGATGVNDIVDIVNDAPFSRFWSPIYGAGDLTILPGDGTRTLAPTFKVDSAASAAPGTLQLVAQLQAMLLATFASDTRRNLRTFVRVAPRNAARLADVASGSALIIGAKHSNAAAGDLFSALPSLRFQHCTMPDVSSEFPIVDGATGRVFGPANARHKPRAERTLRAPRGVSGPEDYGLVTIARIERRTAVAPMIAAHVSGVGPAGLAGAFLALIRPETLSRMVGVAADVMAGREPVAQWLIPTTPAGEPIAEDVICSVSARSPTAGRDVPMIGPAAKAKWTAQTAVARPARARTTAA